MTEAPSEAAADVHNGAAKLGCHHLAGGDTRVTNCSKYTYLFFMPQGQGNERSGDGKEVCTSTIIAGGYFKLRREKAAFLL